MDQRFVGDKAMQMIAAPESTEHAAWYAAMHAVDRARRVERRKEFDIVARIATVDAEIAERVAFRAVLARRLP